MGEVDKEMLKRNTAFALLEVLVFILSFFLYKFYSPPVDSYIWIVMTFGLGSSLFYGWKAVAIFGYPIENKNFSEHSNSWRIHQFWFNFTGSLLGWFLIISSIYGIRDAGIEGINLTYLLVLGFGILGITGLFPSIFSQVPNVLYFLTKKYGEDYLKPEELKEKSQSPKNKRN